MNTKISIILACLLISAYSASWPCQAEGTRNVFPNCAGCQVSGNVWGGSGAYSICTTCTAGFFLNQSACTNCTANCVSCNDNGACSLGNCAPGYTFYPTNSSCVACPAGCLQCIYQTASSAYAYTGNAPFICTACVNNNYYINSAGQCTACADNNIFAGTVNGVNVNFAGLTSGWTWAGGLCTASGNVGGCAAGYISVTTNGIKTCTACGANCNGCSAVGTCTSCVNGYGLNGGTSCIACGVNNCLQCSATGTCTQCASGYSGASCTACTVSNCISCSGGAGVCDIGSTASAGGCASGFAALTTSACTACPANCTTCGFNVASGSPTATACLSGGCAAMTVYQASSTSGANGGTCVPCPANCTTCTLVSGVAMCTQCFHNYTISNGNCLACPANCTNCAANGTAATTAICLQCQLGFGLNDSNGACVQCEAGCDYCDGNAVCTQCRQGQWSGYTAPAAQPPGAGQPNTWQTYNVSQGLYLPPHQCQQCPYNCSTCANSTYCIACNKGYNMSLPGLCLSGERIVLAGFALISVLFYFI